MKEYAAFDAMGLAELVRAGEVSSKELLDEAVSRAHAAQSELNCFSSLYPDLAEAQLADLPTDGPFAGVPFITKDLAVMIDGAPLTNGSVSWKGHVSSQDSVLTERYRKAGLVMFGQTTSPEFGLTTTTESTLYGQTRNPWDVTRTSGGSSGGASAAVAAGVVPLAQASDGGGSIRIPAACTGLFGMKPSRGRTPMGPLQTEGWNGMSTVHAVSRTVRDNAALLDASHGRETGSRYVAPTPEGSFLEAATGHLLESLGHTVVEAAPVLNGEELGKAALFTISANVAAAIDARSVMLGRDVREDELEPITFAMANLGRTVPMMELARANNLFNAAAITFERFLDDQKLDLILTPTLFRPPEKLGVLALTASPEQMNAAVSTFAPLCPLFNQIGAPTWPVRRSG